MNSVVDYLSRKLRLWLGYRSDESIDPAAGKDITPNSFGSAFGTDFVLSENEFEDQVSALPEDHTQALRISKSITRFLQKRSDRHDDEFEWLLKLDDLNRSSVEWRRRVLELANIENADTRNTSLDHLIQEITFLVRNHAEMKRVMSLISGKRVLYAGHCYYYNWYLSRALRKRGWKADVYNWDEIASNQIYYHGEDFRVGEPGLQSLEELLRFFVEALYGYDVFHFSNMFGMSFGSTLHTWFAKQFGENSEIYLIKSLGKKIVYTNNGCHDGVSQTEFGRWGPAKVCEICRWRSEPSVCSDERNLAWGSFRNSIADFQCTLGGNRADFNDDVRVHDVPEYHCVDPDQWQVDAPIPEKFRLSSESAQRVRLYHVVGNLRERTKDDGTNIKSSHVYLPLIRRLQDEGLPIELISPVNIPSREIRYLQMQADIVLEMLTYGWFGANAREGMMLGKPVICYIRPEWLESVRVENPEYADELPIISATPNNVEFVLRELINDAEKRREIGNRSRAFALKWHSASAGAVRMERIYAGLLRDEKMLRLQ